MNMGISKPLNETQRRFNSICELGGVKHGSPPHGLVHDLLVQTGTAMTGSAHEELEPHFRMLSGANPWHVCFALGLSWGRLAMLDFGFTASAVGLLANWNDADLREVVRYVHERGPLPIEQSLRGGFMLFEKVRLPAELPNDLTTLARAQERWLSRIIAGPDRPRYIGSWNATAMFMIALLSKPDLGRELKTRKVMLPPGGPIYNGLAILHRARVLSRPPSGTDLDDQSFEPGAIYENNALIEELHGGLDGWSLLDVHNALYALGTRQPTTNGWI